MNILPQPQQITVEKGKFYTDYNTVIMIHPNCGENVFLYAKMLQETIVQWCGVETDIRKGEHRKGDILLMEAPELEESRYWLEIREEGIIIMGSTEEALLNGVQTLRQMYVLSGGVLEALEIVDYPSIKHRGFYHDVSRGRIPRLSELKKLADDMCYYKCNQLQLYIEHTYLFRDFSEVSRDTAPLTAEEILELDKYCRERHIDLIPSLSTFGHLYMMLRTYRYAEYCELEEDPYRPFSFRHLMHHHTINVSNPKSLSLIKGMIKEYMSLFSSRYFNICGDETFDLCKGRSKYLTEEKEVKDIYTDYVGEICRFVLEHGKIPMFWGDIICGFPEKIKDLPKEVICLNWGYAPCQEEHETKKLADAGAVQYTCPGVGGWNQWVNLLKSAYQNIARMCTYGLKYHAKGVLNTDWGDYGHINQPEFSRPGMIYGAAFSWNGEILSFDEINNRISILLFHDSSGKTASLIAGVEGGDVFNWYDVVEYREMELTAKTDEEKKEMFFRNPVLPEREANETLREIRRKLQENIKNLDSSTRYLLQKYLLGIDAVIIWNKIKPIIAKKIYDYGNEVFDYGKMAQELEQWFMKYKIEWKKVSREDELKHVADIVFWYADLLRK